MCAGNGIASTDGLPFTKEIAMTKKHTGRCACTAAKFEFDTDPTFVAVCHCLDCKKSSGGEAATFFAVPEALLGRRENSDLSPQTRSKRTVSGRCHQSRLYEYTPLLNESRLDGGTYLNDSQPISFVVLRFTTKS